MRSLWRSAVFAALFCANTANAIDLDLDESWYVHPLLKAGVTRVQEKEAVEEYLMNASKRLQHLYTHKEDDQALLIKEAMRWNFFVCA